MAMRAIRSVREGGRKATESSTIHSRMPRPPEADLRGRLHFNDAREGHPGNLSDMPTGLLAGGSYDTNTTDSTLRNHSCSGPDRFFSSTHRHISYLYYYAKSALVQ